MRPALLAILAGAVAAIHASPAVAQEVDPGGVDPDPAMQGGAPAPARGERGLLVAAGLGITLPEDWGSKEKIPGTGQGFYAEVDYVYWPGSWFTPRLYAGMLFTGSRGDCNVVLGPCQISSDIVFAGAKARLMLPVPYVGPFLELGLGLSAGQLTTRVGQVVDATGSGLMYHVPFAIGLALGDRHQWEVSFQYLVHPKEKQVAGAAALGLGFAL